MKILVGIANYGRKNDVYLQRLLSEYRNMPYQTDIVVLTNVRKELGNDVDVVTGLPNRNPHSLPFAHKRLFGERRDAYDLFIYTEDDILLTRRNIEAFLRVSNILSQQELAGFFRWEQFPDGRRFYPDAHSFYRWLPSSVKVVGEYTFARFTDDHAGCFALTRSQLARAIESGGFLVPPHEHSYGLLETAATDPYTQCGFRKLICLSHFDDFIAQHLPNKYIGSRLGLEASEFSKQVEALLDPRRCSYEDDSLLEPETKVFHCRWSKNLYEPCRADLIAMFPPGTRSLLSIGCGWGKTEAELDRQGVRVTAIPLDPIIAACAQSRGIELVYGNLGSAMEQLRERRFDGVLMSGILHLLRDPCKALSQASCVLRGGGVLIATIPNFHRLPFLWLRIQHPSRYRCWRDFGRSGVHVIGKRAAKAWFGNAGLSVERMSCSIPRRWEKIAALSGRATEELFSSEYAFLCRRTTRTTEVDARSAVTPWRGVDDEVNCFAERSTNR
jgi:SAM-dependent methyltransferase